MGVGSSISSINTKEISDKDLKKIYEIERDMWARDDGLGEYIKCTKCESISSKEDVFIELSTSIKNETVSNIERLLNLKNINCPKCGSKDTSFCFGEDYINDIVERYTKSESYLVVYRDIYNEIRGFIDGYTDTIDVIYRREFLRYYNSIGLEKIKNLIEKTIGKKFPLDFFYCTSVGIEEKYKNFLLIVYLIKRFVNVIDEKGRNFVGISELRLGTSIHVFSTLFGSTKIGIGSIFDNSLLGNHNINFNSDIFLTDDLLLNYRNQLSLPEKEFLKKFLKYKKSVIL
ncbi:MAG: hypothetical protein PHN31_03425 [Candidatus Gracilibacteria bacterium]|nr:hypothetical protein [Candidatus Gracilibacteria bacterium]